MQGIDYTPLTTAIALPCTGSLSHEQRNVLSGVLAVAEQETERWELASIREAQFVRGAIRINCPQWVTIDRLIAIFNQLVRAGLIEPFGLRYKLSGMLAGEYAQYKHQTTSVV